MLRETLQKLKAGDETRGPPRFAYRQDAPHSPFHPKPSHPFRVDPKENANRQAQREDFNLHLPSFRHTTRYTPSAIPQARKAAPRIRSQTQGGMGTT